MYVPFNCEACGVKMDADSVSCGTVVGCPSCGAPVTVPFKGPGPGVTLGGFKIRSLLAKGGMGEVFLARQISMDRDVALKILPRTLTTDKEEVERFLNEVRTAARLEHPNIVTAHEAGEDAGYYYLAMAYVKGETLEARLRKTGIMTEAEALGITRKMASALSYAWNKHHLIHRDVKPANIVMDENGEPKLTDMGLSKSLHGPAGVTMDGTVMGTPNYMSPEQAEGAPDVDFRTDIYSLGATLYHMVTARLPFEGKTFMETLRKQAVGTLPDPRDVNLSISDSCALILETMMARRPRDRYASWEALIAELDYVFAGGSLVRDGLRGGLSVVELADKVEIEVVEEPKHRTPDGARGVAPVSGGASSPPAVAAGGEGMAAKAPFLIILGSVAAVAIVVIGVAVGFALKGRGSKGAAVAQAPAAHEAAPAIAAQAPVKPAEPASQSVSNDPWKTVLTAEQIAKMRPRAVAMPATPRADVPPRPSTPAPAVVPVESPRPPPVPVAETVDVRAELEAAADALLKRDPVAAQSVMGRLEGKTLSGDDASIRDGIRAFLQLKGLTIESFKGDVGKEVSVEFKSGRERVQIVSVAGETVKGRRRYGADRGGEAWVEQSFTYPELSATEVIRRAGGVPAEDRGAVMGLLALDSQTPGRAAGLLANATSPFGRFMAVRYVAVIKVGVPVPPEKEDEEAASAKAFLALLKVGKLEPREDEEQLLLEIRKQVFGELQVRDIKLGLAAFNATYGHTACAGKNRRALESLNYIRPNKPMHVDEAVLAEAFNQLQKANPVGAVKPVVTWNEDGLSLDFSKQKNLLVISPLAGLPIVRLDISGTQVRDVSVLRGMPLRVFRGGQGPWSPDLDLRRLASLSLVEFHYEGTDVGNLEWMRGMPLTNIVIRCGRFNAGDLKCLRGMRLHVLRIMAGWSGLVDIGALRGMPLEELELVSDEKSSLSDIKPLSGMKLRTLSLVNSQVSDLSPLAGMPLTRLDVSGTPIRERDLQAIRTLPLKWLGIARTGISNLSGLAGIPLEYLDVRETKVKEFAALKDIPTLKDVAR